MEHKRNDWWNRFGCLLLVGHFVFSFCAVDFLHGDDCGAVDGAPYDADDGCAACLFKLGAHAEQPELVAELPFCTLLEQQVATLVDTVQSNEPACSLPLRAPPV